MRQLRLGGALALASLGWAACAPSGEGGEEAPAVEEAAATVALPDTAGAAVWAYLQQVDYRTNWALWPGKGQLYAGNEPHGSLLTTYLNDAAQQAVASAAGQMPAGAIIVKENYMPDSTLAAVTVMYKVQGYNAEHADWFFSKHLPGGELDTAPNGMALQGRVPGCQTCHMARADNDYVYTAALK